MSWLVSPFVHVDMITSAYAKQRRGHVAILNSVQTILEILGFCVQGHGYRMKYFALRQNVIGHVAKFIPKQQKLLQLAGIQFVRTVIATKDEMYSRQIVRGDQLRPLMEQLRDSTNKEDMVSSAILELVTFCCEEELETLVQYLANTHLQCLTDPLHQTTKRFLSACADGSSISSARSPRSPAISQTASDGGLGLGSPSNGSVLSLTLPGMPPPRNSTAPPAQGDAAGQDVAHALLDEASSGSRFSPDGSTYGPMYGSSGSNSNNVALLALAYGQASHEGFPVLGGAGGVISGTSGLIPSPEERTKDRSPSTERSKDVAGASDGSESSSTDHPVTKLPLPRISLPTSGRMSPGVHMGISPNSVKMGRNSPVDDPLTEAAPWAKNASPRSPLSPKSSTTNSRSGGPQSSPASTGDHVRTGFSLVADITMPALQNAMGSIAGNRTSAPPPLGQPPAAVRSAQDTVVVRASDAGDSVGAVRPREGGVSFGLTNKRLKLLSTFRSDGEDFEET